MDLDPMIVSSHDGDDEHSYSDYDNRPIRPMNQEALNETLARLPILIDDEDYVNRTTGSSESNTSVKARLTNRRQPNLAYSTRRKNLPLATSDINRNNQSLLHVNTTIATPKNNKRKLGGCTPAVTPSATKVIKQLDCRLELIQLKDENKVLQEAKNNLEYECALLKSSHQTELEQLKEQHQQTIDALNQEHQNHSDQWKSSLVEKEQLLVEANLELENLRNERTLLLLEKETLEKLVNDYQNMKEEMTSKLNENESVIKNLREEVETLTKLQQQLREQKQLTTKTSSASTRAQTKVANADRPRTTASTIPVNGKPESTKSKTSSKAPVPRSMKKEERLATPVSINASLNKSNSSLCSSISTLKVAPSKSKMKPSVVIEEKKKSMSSLPSTEKRTSLIATRTRSKAIPAK